MVRTGWRKLSAGAAVLGILLLTSLAAANGSSVIREECRVVMALAAAPVVVRMAPVTDAGVAGRLRPGEWMTVAEEQDGWFRISQPLAGWVVRDDTRYACGYLRSRLMGGSARVREQFIGTGEHTYLLTGAAGQMLTLLQMRPPGEAGRLLPTVYDPEGRVLLRGDSTGGGDWSGRLERDGEYRLVLESHYKGYAYDFAVRISGETAAGSD